ncbi:hypothetical protein ACNKHV_21340 [Shigella flexneri]
MGDDEHGRDDDGVLNLEVVYSQKTINLLKKLSQTSIAQSNVMRYWKT